MEEEPIGAPAASGNGGEQMAKKEQKSEKRSRIIGRRYRYTGDYRVVPALGEGGARGKRVIYTADWIVPRLEEGELRALVLRLRLLVGLAVLAVAVALQIIPVPTEYKWYLPVLTVSLFPLAYQILGAAALPAAKKPMERQKFDKSFVRIRHCAVFALVVFALTALGVVIYWIVYAAGGLPKAAGYSLQDGLFAALLLLAAAAELASFRFLRGLATDTLENSAYQP